MLRRVFAFAAVLFAAVTLSGCFVASIIMGLIQTFSVVIDGSLADLLKHVGITVSTKNLLGEILSIPGSRIGPLLPYALMILMLMIRPRGLLGNRDT